MTRARAIHATFHWLLGGRCRSVSSSIIPAQALQEDLAAQSGRGSKSEQQGRSDVRMYGRTRLRRRGSPLTKPRPSANRNRSVQSSSSRVRNFRSIYETHRVLAKFQQLPRSVRRRREWQVEINVHRISTSFLRKNQRVQGGLYWASEADPIMRRWCAFAKAINFRYWLPHFLAGGP